MRRAAYVGDDAAYPWQKDDEVEEDCLSDVKIETLDPDREKKPGEFTIVMACRDKEVTIIL
jgi:hypothetical protein